MKSRFQGLWRHADFMKLWTGETISMLGSTITVLALPLTAESILKANAQEMGILGAAGFLPFLWVLFSPVRKIRVQPTPENLQGEVSTA